MEKPNSNLTEAHQRNLKSLLDSIETDVRSGQFEEAYSHFSRYREQTNSTKDAQEINRQLHRDGFPTIEITDGTYSNRETETKITALTNRLNKDMQASVSAGDAERFRKLEKQFETRAVKDGLNPEEVIGTYKQALKLLEMSGSDITVQPVRGAVASQIVWHAAETNIDQGLHNTCTADVIENMMFSNEPSKAAELIVSTVANQQWTAPDGKTIKLPSDIYQAGDEEQSLPRPDDGDRSYASQIFQSVVLNDYFQRLQKPEIYKYGDPRRIPDIEILRNGRFHKSLSQFVPGDTTTDMSGKPHKHYFEGLPLGAAADEMNRLTGEGRILADANDRVSSASDIAPESRSDRDAGAKRMVQDGDKLIDFFDSTDSLRSTLVSLQTAGELPVVISVNGDGIAFSGKPIIHEANHVVVIREYDPANDSVYINNSWGAKYNRWVSIDKLARSTGEVLDL